MLQEESAGHGVMDCGATENVQGIETAEKELQASQHQFELDKSTTREFRYGNDGTSESLGVLTREAPLTGEVSSHLIEGGAPLLLSVLWLKEMKAVIDFDSNTGMLRAVNNDVVQFPTASSGHLMVPLSGNLTPATDAIAKRYTGFSQEVVPTTRPDEALASQQVRKVLHIAEGAERHAGSYRDGLLAEPKGKRHEAVE
jgi:hypothetical protein